MRGRFSIGLLALVVLAIAGASAAKKSPPADTPAWTRVEYGSLVDTRRLTHSGEPVGTILARLGGRPRPPDGDRSADGLDHRLIDPVLEPYGFVLSDAIDAARPVPERPLVEIAGLYEPGGAEPAWVELCRARRFVVESDGAGFVRVVLPSPALEALPFDDTLPRLEVEESAQDAWRAAWPVLRHVLAAERRRLARAKGGTPPALEVDVYAYRHLMSRSAFVVAARPWRKRVDSTASEGGRPPLDTAPLRAILERGQTIEGARLDASGRVRWLTGDSDLAPRILGRAPEISDLAVAYRAVAHGGYGEAYMSLDRGAAPHFAEVNYGGRLRDTALGMVSMLSDVRFKTFSVGIDLLGEGDARASIRKTVPDFRTHLERFASDPTAGTVLNQQTRFWFYPDDVDLTLSAEGDVLAFRRVSMAAASERVGDEAKEDPAWTRAMVTFLNERHEDLVATFPEIASLDESVRYLALFTWLHAARARGLPVPDLDVLLDVELPAVPTPRRFPQLLSYDVLPPPGTEGEVGVYDRSIVGEALDRLEPRDGRRLPAARSFQRALSQLDRRVPDQAALAQEMEAQSASSDLAVVDRLAYRAERLLVHTRVLATLPPEQRSAVEARRTSTPSLRVFSVGIGGVDLGMSAVLARATTQSHRMGLGGAVPAASPASPPARAGTPDAPVVDPASRPGNVLPDHGLGAAAERTGALLRAGTFKAEGGKTVTWQESRSSVEGPEARMRRRVEEPGSPPLYERVEDGRFLSYRLDRRDGALYAAPVSAALPHAPFREGAPSVPADPLSSVSEQLVLLDLLPSSDGPAEPSAVGLRVRAAPDLQRTAEAPRAMLRRLVLGREVDATPDRPLAAFTPARQVLGAATVMMVLQSAAETAPPWGGPRAPRSGEEDAARIARALTLWWGADPANGGAVAVVGTSAKSASRWAGAPALAGEVVLVENPGEAPKGKVIVLASPEAPGVLGARLRALARDPAMKGAIVAVAPLAGPLRGDLPASLLAEGQLAAIGVLDGTVVHRGAAAERVRSWVRAASEPAARGKRAEQVPGPFTWFY